jgi:hypothetical protein
MPIGYDADQRSAPTPINSDCCHFATLPGKASPLALASRESLCCSAQLEAAYSLTAGRD